MTVNKDGVGSAHNGLADRGLDHFKSLDGKGMALWKADPLKPRGTTH